MLRSVVRSTSSPSLLRLPGLSSARNLHTRTTLLTRTALPRRVGPIGKTSKLVNDPRVRKSIIATTVVGGPRLFHATRRNDSLPIFLAGFLKASTALELVRTIARIALTFVPVLIFKKYKLQRKLQWAEKRGDKELVQKLETYMAVQNTRHKVIMLNSLLVLPLLIFMATILASIERTPLTGRWRLILLSPDEEEEISKQLAGTGWYQAVGDILTQEGDNPVIIPPTDWRFRWVRDTLRRLESVIPLLSKEAEMEAKWLECGPHDVPLPPPADYPLKPRPRASEMVRRFAEMSCGRAPPPVPHGIPGPPYSLIVVDKPGSSNAFSYGFGPDGGGGVVVFSGFLDDILSKYPPATDIVTPAPAKTWWSSLFGSLSTAQTQSHPIPTEEQTSELAILLAHELSHLILSHHLETLSSGSVMWPGILSIGTDIIRALAFPVTMMFGPFVNDALASMGKVSSSEITKLTEYCTSQRQEIEADVVSARLLAHAGFDPRHAVRFWEERQETEQTAECTPAKATRRLEHEKWEAELIPLPWTGNTHPINLTRVNVLKEELNRWERQRARARKAIQEAAEQSQLQS